MLHQSVASIVYNNYDTNNNYIYKLQSRAAQVNNDNSYTLIYYNHAMHACMGEALQLVGADIRSMVPSRPEIPISCSLVPVLYREILNQQYKDTSVIKVISLYQ